MRNWLLALALVAATSGSVDLRAQKDDPQLGTWVLNLSKSTFKPGPPPKSQTRIFALTDRGIKYTSEGIDATGKPTHAEYIANFDGKDYPVSGAPDADTIALKRLDSHTLEVIQKRHGKVAITGTRAISKDGRRSSRTKELMPQVDRLITCWFSTGSELTRPTLPLVLPTLPRHPATPTGWWQEWQDQEMGLASGRRWQGSGRWQIR